MQSYLYNDDVQSDELPECRIHEEEMDYWEEKFKIEQQLKTMGLHK